MAERSTADRISHAVNKATSAHEQANGNLQIEYLADAVRELAKALQELNRRVESGLASKS
jgi:hypothetical protein